MKLIKSYVTNEQGEIQDVIISYKKYKQIEEIILNIGMGKAMEEYIEDEEISLEDAKKLTNYNSGS